MHERRSLVVVLHDETGHRGYGESPPFELPFYSEETLAGARDLLEHVLIPRVVGLESSRPRRWTPRCAPGVRGNSFARAAIETAAWDLEAHRRNTGLAALLAERLGVRAGRSVPCGVALGIPLDRSAETLAAVDRRRARGRVPAGQDQGRARMGRGPGAGRPRGDGRHRSAAHGGRQRRVRVARARARAAGAGRGGPALHRAAAASRRAGGPRAPRRAAPRPRSAWTRPCGTPAPPARSWSSAGRWSGT